MEKITISLAKLLSNILLMQAEIELTKDVRPSYAASQPEKRGRYGEAGACPAKVKRAENSTSGRQAHRIHSGIVTVNGHYCFNKTKLM